MDKAKLNETTDLGGRRIWIVTHVNQGKEYRFRFVNKKAARELKALLDSNQHRIEVTE